MTKECRHPLGWGNLSLDAWSSVQPAQPDSEKPSSPVKIKNFFNLKPILSSLALGVSLLSSSLASSEIVVTPRSLERTEIALVQKSALGGEEAASPTEQWLSALVLQQTRESVHPLLSSWESHLRDLATKGLQRHHAEYIRLFWNYLKKGNASLPPPQAGQAEDGGPFEMMWMDEKHTFDLEIWPDGHFEWYFSRSKEDATGGEGQIQVGKKKAIDLPEMETALHRWLWTGQASNSRGLR